MDDRGGQHDDGQGGEWELGIHGRSRDGLVVLKGKKQVRPSPTWVKVARWGLRLADAESAYDPASGLTRGGRVGGSRVSVVRSLALEVGRALSDRLTPVVSAALRPGVVLITVAGGTAAAVDLAVANTGAAT